MMNLVSRQKKISACLLLLLLLNQMVFSTVAFALTSGPSQPEVQSFEPVNTDKMVDLFTGDFVYNVPLMDVGGYPINISYHSGITMDQEASWTGLGWNINPGVINRNMRGLPDDFRGDPVVKEYNINPNWTAGVDLGASFQPVDGPLGLGANLGLFYNNYKGIGFKAGTSFNFSFGKEGQGAEKTSGLKSSFGLGLSFNSQEGVGVSPSMGLSLEKNSADQSSTGVGLNLGLSYNNRAGLSALSLGLSASYSKLSTPLSRGSFNGSSTLTFAATAVTPSIEMPLETFGFTCKLQAGGEIPTVDFQVGGSVTGSYSRQKLVRNRDTLSGFGYLYFDQVAHNPRALMDFNREKDQPFRKPSRLSGDEGTPIMAIPNYEFDVLGVSGQGIGGSYRPMRGDLGSIYDHRTTTTSSSGTLNGDVNFGGYLTVGSDIDVNIINTTTSYWDDDNDLHSPLSFYPSDNTLYEPSYYVNVGEKTINDQDFYDAIGDEDPLRPKVDGWWLQKKLTRTLEQYRGHNKQREFVLTKYKKGKRTKRNQAISFLTAEEFHGALDEYILNFPENQFLIENCNQLPDSMKIKRRVHANNRNSHLTEVSALGADGKRYVYGIPAYNRVQKEVTFAVNANKQALPSGITRYGSKDNTIQNTNGLDHYYSSQQIPDFSHSFLLTAVLSPDYVDLTGNGVSDDDLGDAVKINYSRTYPKRDQSVGFGKPNFYNTPMYKWRVPVDSMGANYQEGFKCYESDDKANYLYGEKEIWYVNSIESKTMVAVFHTSDRQDALGVKGENGGIDTASKLKKLDRIDLFSKSDMLKYGHNAVPIKSVHFNYSYTLCPGLPNHMTHQGKLTLESMYFTYQKNTKGRLNPYVFHYDNPNPGYHLKHYDRWGGYKSNTAAGITALDSEFPYTIQDGAISDSNARAWSLSSIDLPTGGEIKVKLEADRYAYVQDKRAMQMSSICGLGTSENFDPGSVHINHLYDIADPKRANYSYYVYVKVNDPITSSNPAEKIREVKAKYLEGINDLYFRAAVVMTNQALADADYVPGYAKIDTYGVCPGHNDVIFLKLATQPLNNGNISGHINPIHKTALQTLRMNIPALAYPGSEAHNQSSFVDVIKSLVAPLMDIENIFFGFGGSSVFRGWCQKIDLSRSWVRLNNPTFNKLGGGCRVKQVTIHDHWSDMVTGETSSEYGQIYDYTMTDDETKQVISSGVAEYEPMTGNDENPWRQPLTFHQNTLLAPHNQFYIETPIGESFFPGAGVGYRQIKVSSYGSTQVAAEKRTGHSLHKFYTAYDFPVSTDYTPLSPNLDKTPFIFQILQLPSIEHFIGTQGFKVELNDMHGKPRSEEVYDNVGACISKTTYEYDVEDPNALHKKLNTKVIVMKPDGTTIRSNVGKDIELMFDSRKQETIAQNYGGLFQVDMVQIPPPLFVLPLFTYFPAFAREETVFKSMVTTKVVRKYGLIKSVTTQQYGSVVKSENLVYDSETGEVLLTKTLNEYEDPLYNFTMPAHMAYTGMAPASQNVGAVFKGVNIHSGITIPATISDYLTAGDELLYSLPPNTILSNTGIAHVNEFDDIKLWVIDPNSMDPSKPSQKVLVDQSGHPFTNTGIRSGKLKVVRSGHRNMQTIPIASISSLSSPLRHDGNTAFDTLDPGAYDSIINVTNTEYSEKWKINCDKVPALECDVCKAPTCDCMKNLLIQVLATLQNHHNPTLQDNLTINTCCIDSCFFASGAASGVYDGCERPIYAVDTNPNHYVVMIGRCTLTIANQGLLGSRDRSLSTLVVEDGDDEIIYDGACATVCDMYNADGSYYLMSLQAGSAPVPFKATLDCGQRCNPSCVNIDTGGVINPYRYGLLGNWRPAKQWAYRGIRTGDTILPDGTTNIRKQGVFQTFAQFWVYDQSQKAFVKNPNLSKNYIEATRITKYNTKGAEIENRDAAGIYSAAQFGYLQTQAVAVAKNARFKQIGFDGFEDYDFISDCRTPCRLDHFNYEEALCNECLNAEMDTMQAHTGHRSIKVLGAGTGYARMSRDIRSEYDGPNMAFDSMHNDYKLRIDGCLPKFSPDSGRYFVSVWVHEPDTCLNTGYKNSLLKISFSGHSNQYSFMPSGHIIDGWQRIQGVFDVPAGANQIHLDLAALNGKDAYFDDIRVQPFNSSMKSYVYDWRSLRLMAELDENNFATFYEYDDEGILIRIKKETERGIMTIQETRSALKKKPL